MMTMLRVVSENWLDEDTMRLYPLVNQVVIKS